MFFDSYDEIKASNVKNNSVQNTPKNTENRLCFSPRLTTSLQIKAETIIDEIKTVIKMIKISLKMCINKSSRR